MRLGIAVPQFGDAASPDNLRAVATEAEALGYDSVWVGDRVIYPVAPRSPYPGSRDGSLPRVFQRSLAPLAVLSFAAACTRRVALGVSVLALPLYNPVLLARELTSIDVLSGGRLRVGVGLGWSQDEYDAAGVDMKTRGARAYEAIDLIRKMWTEDTPEHHGTYYTLPKSIMRLRPVQAPHPPIYIAAYSEAALKRVATHGDGWNPAGMPIPAMKTMFEGVRATARALGREPRSIQLVVRANLHVTEAPITSADRASFAGSWDQIRADVAAVREIGAHEVHFDPQFSPGVEDVASMLAMMRRLREMAG
jgi:probable F420-dependent oxidoreductase